MGRSGGHCCHASRHRCRQCLAGSCTLCAHAPVMQKSSNATLKHEAMAFHLRECWYAKLCSVQAAAVPDQFIAISTMPPQATSTRAQQVAKEGAVESSTHTETSYQDGYWHIGGGVRGARTDEELAQALHHRNNRTVRLPYRDRPSALSTS